MNTTQQTVAIVTGASRGIGLGLTQALLGRGWQVVATALTILVYLFRAFDVQLD